MEIRTASDADAAEVRRVVESAFGHESGLPIADLVAELVRDPSAEPRLSLVAEIEERVIGHVLFTRARLEGPKEDVACALLAPLAVAPDAQSRGVGSKLVREGLKQLAESGVALVFVLGYPDYYTRHGFRPAGERGFEAPYPILPRNADAWMVQALADGVIGRVRGTVRCAEALDRPEHWRE